MHSVLSEVNLDRLMGKVSRSDEYLFTSGLSREQLQLGNWLRTLTTVVISNWLGPLARCKCPEIFNVESLLERTELIHTSHV